jgi:hypothetical protein
MDRLTDTTANKCCYDTWDLCGLDSVCKRDCWKPEPCKIPKIVNRLTEYEDAEEAGLLIRLPCKVGTPIHCIISGTINSTYKVKSFGEVARKSFAVGRDEDYGWTWLPLSEFGVTVFLSKQAAIDALKVDNK